MDFIPILALSLKKKPFFFQTLRLEVWKFGSLEVTESQSLKKLKTNKINFV